MPQVLSREEIVTIQVLARNGQKNTEIARTLGVCEGTVRYHRKRSELGAVDGRSGRYFKAQAYAEIIGLWHEDQKEGNRPVNNQDLFEHLQSEYGYEGSYKSVLRFVRRYYPKPLVRTYRRVETPPGAQTQTDWGEYPRVNLGGILQPLHAFVMVLSHSRKPAVIWSHRENQLNWLHCHNESYRRFGGVAAVNRIDNVKTAMLKGAGCWGTIHQTYRAYSRSVGFHIDACESGAANAKGKVEAKVRLSRLRLDPGHRYFEDIEVLQRWSDARLEAWCRKAICPATGQSVEESWRHELSFLAPLPILPEPFDVAVTRPVHRDCMVNFESHHYAVPFQWVGTQVEVRGCASTVQILAEGRVVKEHPRHTRRRVLVDPECYEGEATDRVLPPLPLGKMGLRLQEIMDMPVQERPLDLYSALSEVAR